jgi:hypothetical protein
MERSSFPASTLDRHELEDTWRARLDESRRQYQEASTGYRGMLDEKSDGQPPGMDSPLAHARQAESKALLEYCRVLRIFSGLTVHGKLPQQSFDAACGHANKT